MTFKKSVLLVSSFSLLTLSACAAPGGPATKVELEDAQYWQRKNSSSALYLQGPKAQQFLHRDIATCTNEIRELENLGEIRRAIPANYSNGNTTEPRTAAQTKLDEWDSPERDGYLRNEHLDYVDFETCMTTKGWERLEYLPHTAAEKARQDYLRQYGQKKRSQNGNRENVTTLDPASQNPPPFKNLNE